MQKIKVNKKFLSLLLAGTITLSFAGCAGNHPKDDSTKDIISILSVDEEGKKVEQPSYYELYNLNENPGIDKEYGIVYYKLKDKWPKILNVLVSKEITVDEVDTALEMMKEDLEFVKENSQGKDFKTEILSNDDSAFLSKIYGDLNYAVLVYTDKKEGYAIYFLDNLKLRSYENLNCVVSYDNDKKRICVLDKTKGCLSVINNAAYLGCEDGIVSFTRTEDPNNIYYYNVNSYKETKQAVTDLKVLDKYVTYNIIENGKKVFKIIDVLTLKEQTFENKENFWITLSDKSILYVNKNFEYTRYEKDYNLLDGSFESEYCILNNLSTSPDKNGKRKNYRNSIYFNRKLDIFCEVPNFDFMEEHDTKKGYFKYVSDEKSTYLVDLTTCDRYFEKGTVDSKDYSIINVSGIPSDKKNYTIFKDKNGKTVASIETDGIGPGYVWKYFDDTKTAIQCPICIDNVFQGASLLDLSDLENPKKIISSDFNTSYDMILTPIDNTLILYNNSTKKYKLINQKGEALLNEEYDLMRFKYYCDKKLYILEVANEPYPDMYYPRIVYDANGNIIKQNTNYNESYKYIDSQCYTYESNVYK